MTDTFQYGPDKRLRREGQTIHIEEQTAPDGWDPNAEMDVEGFGRLLDWDRPTVYIANSGKGWGKAFSEYGALREMAPHVGSVDEPFELTIVEAKGDAWINRRGTRVGVGGIEIVEWTRYEVQPDHWNRLVEVLSGRDVAAESVLVNAETVEEGAPDE